MPCFLSQRRSATRPDGRFDCDCGKCAINLRRHAYMVERAILLTTLFLEINVCRTVFFEWHLPTCVAVLSSATGNGRSRRVIPCHVDGYHSRRAPTQHKAILNHAKTIARRTQSIVRDSARSGIHQIASRTFVILDTCRPSRHVLRTRVVPPPICHNPPRTDSEIR